MLNINNQGNIISPNGATLLYGSQIIDEDNVSIADENMVLEPYEILIVDEDDDDLEQIINEINNKQNKLIGNQGQIVSFNADGNAIAQDMPTSMPEVTTSDNGKFLRVVNGTWAASTVPNAEEASF